ncbi:MAG TPA: tripartite tricarboxylate transporter substrate-binding protein, partial [Xanthobacteraceae bacterium]
MSDAHFWRNTAALIFSAFTLALAAAGSFDHAVAQSYPARPITMIMPFAAGGPSDVIARTVADHMSSTLGQPVIVETVPSASGLLGVERAARATPDGYTISLGTWPTHVLNGALFQLPYDLRTAFAPVSLIASNPMLIVSRKDFPATNLKELIAWLLANPDKAMQGATGQGSSGHIAGTFFQKATGTRFRFIFYRSNAQQVQDLMADRIDLMFDFPSTALPHIREGSIKAYAVTDGTRLTGAPEIPTTDEAGLPNFHLTGWHALFVPKGTSSAVIKTLNAAVSKALADPQVRKRLTDLG